VLENQITITLSEGLKHIQPQHAGDRSIPVQHVEIDLALSAYSNAQLYYDHRRKHAAKQSKAESASALAIKAAEKKTNVALSNVDQKARIQKVRKVYWFEVRSTNLGKICCVHVAHATHESGVYVCLLCV